MDFVNQTELFEHIFNTRPWFSEISGQALPRKGHSLHFWCYSHILPKGLYGLYKLKDFNICLMTPEEHTFYGKFKEKDKEKPMYRDYSVAWDALFELKEVLKQKYHRDKTVL